MNNNAFIDRAGIFLAILSFTLLNGLSFEACAAPNAVSTNEKELIVPIIVDNGPDEFQEVRFKGKIESIDYGCVVDAFCYMLVSGRRVEFGSGPPLGLGIWGQPIGIFSFLGKSSMLIGKYVEVYCNASFGYSLKGDTKYYIKIISPSITEVLQITLDNLDLENPKKDAFGNYLNRNLEFVGIDEDTCWPPGFGNDLPSLVKKSGWTCLDGTSDTLEGDEHSKLMEIAQKYATEYNRYLLEIIEKENQKEGQKQEEFKDEK